MAGAASSSVLRYSPQADVAFLHYTTYTTASFALFLASDEAAYVTGSTYYVDGGMSRWNQGL